MSLASRIETLRKDGIPDKIEKAAAKRYKMTQADLGKADQLTKANAEFQARCSTVRTAPVTADVPPSTDRHQGAGEEDGQGEPPRPIDREERSHAMDCQRCSRLRGGRRLVLGASEPIFEEPGRPGEDAIVGCR